MKGYSLLTGITIIKITQGLLFQLTKQHQTNTIWSKLSRLRG